MPSESGRARPLQQQAHCDSIVDRLSRVIDQSRPLRELRAELAARTDRQFVELVATQALSMCLHHTTSRAGQHQDADVGIVRSQSVDSRREGAHRTIGARQNRVARSATASRVSVHGCLAHYSVCFCFIQMDVGDTHIRSLLTP